MKTILTTSILLAGMFLCHAQDDTDSAPDTTPETNAVASTPSFDGDWRGPMKWVAGEESDLKYRFRIVIHGDKALAYLRKNNKWEEMPDESSGVVKYIVLKMRNICVVNWLNQDTDGIWTEEQTYSLSYISPTKIRAIQLRHVSNRKEGKNGSSWFYVCGGNLTKTTGEVQN